MVAVKGSVSHDMLQSMGGDLERTHAGEGEQGPQLAFPVQDLEQAAGVPRRVTAEGRHGLLVAAELALARGLAAGPPDQRVEPPEEPGEELQVPDEHVAPPDVDQLVGEDQLELVGTQAAEQGGGQEDGGPEHAEGGRAEGAFRHQQADPACDAQRRARPVGRSARSGSASRLVRRIPPTADDARRREEDRARPSDRSAR